MCQTSGLSDLFTNIFGWIFGISVIYNGSYRPQDTVDINLRKYFSNSSLNHRPRQINNNS